MTTRKLSLRNFLPFYIYCNVIFIVLFFHGLPHSHGYNGTFQEVVHNVLSGGFWSLPGSDKSTHFYSMTRFQKQTKPVLKHAYFLYKMKQCLMFAISVLTGSSSHHDRRLLRSERGALPLSSSFSVNFSWFGFVFGSVHSRHSANLLFALKKDNIRLQISRRSVHKQRTAFEGSALCWTCRAFVYCSVL